MMNNVLSLFDGMSCGRLALDKTQYRKLTPLECERLQTVPDNYTNQVSNTQ
jgi:site-specific DNA-cytosine methylase